MGTASMPLGEIGGSSLGGLVCTSSNAVSCMDLASSAANNSAFLAFSDASVATMMVFGTMSTSGSVV